MIDRISIVKARLPIEEGRKKFAYNDATGKRVTCQPNGNLSIAVGCNLEIGLYDNEIDFITENRITIANDSIKNYWWMQGLDEVRASVIIDLVFNEGLPHLLGFVKMLGAVGDKSWVMAAHELLDSDAARKDPNRYEPLSRILYSGELP